MKIILPCTVIIIIMMHAKPTRAGGYMANAHYELLEFHKMDVLENVTIKHSTIKMMLAAQIQDCFRNVDARRMPQQTRTNSRMNNSIDDGILECLSVFAVVGGCMGRPFIRGWQHEPT